MPAQENTGQTNAALTGADQNATGQTEATELNMMDRQAPIWGLGTSALLTAMTIAIVLGVSVATAFLHRLVIVENELNAAFLIAGVVAIPTLSILFLEGLRHRSLSGFRYMREGVSVVHGGAIAVMILAFIATVHPLLVLPTLCTLALAAGGILVATHFARNEPMWDFQPEQALSFLSGRDEIGRDLAQTQDVEHPLVPSIHFVSIWMSVLLTYAVGSWLAARTILAIEALAAVVLITILAVDLLLRCLREFIKKSRLASVEAKTVTMVSDEEDEPRNTYGIHVRGLSLTDRTGRALLSDVNFECLPGTITAVIGESGSGKSLLLQAMIDPFSLDQCDITGEVSANGHNLWDRRPDRQDIQAVRVGTDLALLPVSGAENLACFHEGALLERGKSILHQMVFSTDVVQEICQTPDATHLPGTYARCLAFARAFLLAPSLYLFDTPEIGMPEKQIGAFLNRLRQEMRFGRSAIVVTENRQLAEACDRIVVLQGGRIVDYGEADETRKRLGTGWRRFVGRRQLEIEDNLHSWIRSHFKRDGDEGNRRNVSMVASELLAFSCLSADEDRSSRLILELKHYQGFCKIRMVDDSDPISSASLQMAKEQAQANTPGKTLPPLARLLKSSLEFDTHNTDAQRTIVVTVETYDPRLTNPNPGHKKAEKSAAARGA